MHCSRSFLLRLCLSLAVSMGSCTCKPLRNDIQSEDPDELYSQLSEEDLLDEEVSNARMEDFLGTMKEGFLRKLNLSDVPQEHGKIYPPQFMMELYNKYASDSSAIPQSDVIRSFSVQGIPIYNSYKGIWSFIFRYMRNMLIHGCTEEVKKVKLKLYCINDLFSCFTSMFCS